MNVSRPLLLLHSRVLQQARRLLRGPVPFEHAHVAATEQETRSAEWDSHIRACIEKDPADPYLGLVAARYGMSVAHRMRQEQPFNQGPVPGVLSLEFLRREAAWRLLSAPRLWATFQTIAWALHAEVNRVAYTGALGGRDDLVFVLTRGGNLTGGGAGALCTGWDAEGTTRLRPFATIAIAREFHPDYVALKETFLHELAHWAAFRDHGPHARLGASEVATAGHGDYWRAHVTKIQAVFGDFCGYRHAPCGLVKRSVPVAAAAAAAAAGQQRGVMRGVRSVLRLETPVYFDAFECPACWQRVRYASRGSTGALRSCSYCGYQGLRYLGKRDPSGRALRSERGDGPWHAFVREHASRARVVAREAMPGAPAATVHSSAMRTLATWYRAARTRHTPATLAPVVSTALLGGPGAAIPDQCGRYHRSEGATGVDTMAGVSVKLHRDAASQGLTPLGVYSRGGGGGIGDVAKEMEVSECSSMVRPTQEGEVSPSASPDAGQLTRLRNRAGWLAFVQVNWPLARRAVLGTSEFGRANTSKSRIAIMRCLRKWWRTNAPAVSSADGALSRTRPAFASNAQAAISQRVAQLKARWQRHGGTPWSRVRSNQALLELLARWGTAHAKMEP